MNSLDSQEVTNEITGFLYLWRSDKIRRIVCRCGLKIHFLAENFSFNSTSRRLRPPDQPQLIKVQGNEIEFKILPKYFIRSTFYKSVAKEQKLVSD